MQRVRSLDGIRGLSILIILFTHGIYSLPKALTHNNVCSIIIDSHIWVMLFFVISGYLITKLLLIEKEKNGNISIKNFYLRRIFRIFPVFYFFIFIVVLLKLTVLPTIYSDTWTVIFAGLHLWNYKHLLPFIHQLNEKNGYWFFGHFWSLSMEEQFYLIWPFLFRKFGITSLKKGIIVLLLLMPFIRVATYFIFPGSRGQVDMMLHTGGTMILMGCLGALLETSDKFMTSLKEKLKNKWIVGSAFFFLFIINWYLNDYFKGAYWLPVGQSVVAVILLFLIFWCIYIPSRVQNFLNSYWIKQVGLISYSLFIWQQLILTDLYKSYINMLPFNFITVFILALISYNFIEKPFNKLKKKFKRISIKETRKDFSTAQNAL